MARVTFEPVGVTIELADGQSMFEAARGEGLLLPTACVGRGTCGLCRVKILEGAEHLPPPNAVEKRHLGNTYFITRLRLSCQLQPAGDVKVEIPDLAKKKR
jgi:ferredoxin